MPFVTFLNDNNFSVEPSRYDGYLSFIPEAHCPNPDKQPAHRYLYNDNFYWLEVKDAVQQSPQQLAIDSNRQCLWIHIDLSGRSVLLTKAPNPLSTGEILCYQQAMDSFNIQLNNGKNWIFMIGISSPNFDKLATEYPTIKTWLDQPVIINDCTILGKMSVHAKLFSILESLKRIDFRPFGTYYLLMSWNLRIFDIVFKETKTPTSSEKDHEVKLYHDTIAYLRKHYNQEDLTLKSIAQAMNVSIRTLTRSFANRPHSVNEYLQELRLVAAKDRILNSDNTIISIAFSLHFACQKSFSKIFKKRFGYSPTIFREKTRIKRTLVN